MPIDHNVCDNICVLILLYRILDVCTAQLKSMRTIVTVRRRLKLQDSEPVVLGRGAQR